MYIYNVCISTYIQFLTFWFLLLFFFYSQQAAKKREFKCIFKFLSMLFSAASVVYSIRIWWNLFCCSIPRNTKKSTFLFLRSYISIIVVIALEGNKCFQSYILERNSSENILIFFCRLFFFFLYLVISCFLNWFLFFLAVSISFGIIMLPPILVLFQFLTWINYKFFFLIHSFVWNLLTIDERKKKNKMKMDQSWIITETMGLLIPSLTSSFFYLFRFISWKDKAKNFFLKKIYSVNIFVKMEDLSKWISLDEGTWNSSKEIIGWENIVSINFKENLKK